jgi:hypothetical protein
MQDKVRTFARFAGTKPIMKSCVKAMEQGALHVDAVNCYGHTFGVVFINESSCHFEDKYWLRYWALKPSVHKFWTVLINYCPMSCLETVLLKTAGIAALWEDLSFIYNLVATTRNVRGLREEVERRMTAALRFAWIAAVVKY